MTHLLELASVFAVAALLLAVGTELFRTMPRSVFIAGAVVSAVLLVTGAVCGNLLTIISQALALACWVRLAYDRTSPAQQ